MKFATLILMFLVSSQLFASAEKICSPLNFCRIDKKTWDKKGWKTPYTKELKIEHFCDSDRPQIQLEKELGLELWLFSGDAKEGESFRSKPYITLNLYTYKLTNVVATASSTADSKLVNFSHRLNPKRSALVEVTCWQK